MPVRQLTLYDFLADFVPGTFAVVLAAVGFQATRGSLLALPLDLGLGSGILVVVLCYLTGRTIHLFAGQHVLQSLRVAFDHVLNWYGRRHAPGYAAVEKEPVASDMIGDALEAADSEPLSDDLTTQQVIYREVPHLVHADVTDRILDWEREPTERPESLADDFADSRRVAYSYLFDGSTLYQRYNIQETYYRNLWAVTMLALLVVVSSVLAVVALSVVSLDQVLVFGFGSFSIAVLVFGVAGLLATDLTLSLLVPDVLQSDGLVLVSVGVLLAIVCGALWVLTSVQGTPDGNDERTGNGSPNQGEVDWQSFSVALIAVLGSLTGVAITFFGVVLSRSVDLLAAPGVLTLSLVGFPFLATMFEIRRRQFKRRQERALLNDLLLHLSDDEDDD